MRRIRRFAIVCALAAIGLLGGAALTESWLEVQDAKRLAGTETFVEVGDAHVRYRLAGRGQPGPTVVLLSGFAGTVEQWDHVQSRVSAFAPVLAYDRGGLGFSRGSSAHDAQQQADELAGLLAALGLHRRIVLVGFSGSASIARVFVGRYRERVAGLVLAAPYLPELEGLPIPGHHGPWRNFTRILLHESVTTFFGFKRFAGLVDARRGRPAASSGVVEQRATAILIWFRHWWAVDREMLALSESTRQALAADALGDLPLILVSDGTMLEETGPVVDGLAREFVARSSRGSLRSFGSDDHGTLLENVKASQALVDAIRDLTTMTP